MKLKSGFITQTVGGEHITVSAGVADFSGLIRSNETAAFIIEKLKSDTTAAEISAAVADAYDAPVEVITADVEKIIEQLRRLGAIDE